MQKKAPVILSGGSSQDAVKQMRATVFKGGFHPQKHSHCISSACVHLYDEVL